MLLASTPSRLFALAAVGQILFGLVLALPGTLFGVPAWSQAVGFDVASQARLLVVFFAGQLVCTALAGSVVDRFGSERVLAFGAATIGVALVLLARATTTPAAITGAAFLAVGGASINAATNTLVSVTYGERRGSMLSLMAMFGACGSLSAPFLFAGGLDAAGAQQRLALLVPLAAAAAVLPLIVGPAPHVRTGSSLAEMMQMLGERPLQGLIALLLLEFGNEAVLAGWTAAFAIAVFPGSSGASIIGAYWAGLCLGRVLAPLVLARAAKLVVVLGAAIAAAAGTLGMAVAPDPAQLTLAVFVSGLAIGPLAPTIVSVAGDRYPRRTGAAIGLLLSVAQTGGIVLPWLVGRVTVARGFREAMLVPCLGSLGIAAGAAAAWYGRAARARGATA